MKKADFYSKEFPWEEISTDDYKCILGDYCLRVENMDTNHWWWRVYYKDTCITDHTREFAKSKMLAIGYCEGVYIGHSVAKYYGI